jgi:hypothetical protein
LAVAVVENLEAELDKMVVLAAAVATMALVLDN